jgi:hypothetical protein
LLRLVDARLGDQNSRDGVILGPIGAIGQVLGSIAVFVTLGYLTLQVRHAREEVRRSVTQTRLDTAVAAFAGALALPTSRVSVSPLFG